jgi:hypothetical protein
MKTVPNLRFHRIGLALMLCAVASCSTDDSRDPERGGGVVMKPLAVTQLTSVESPAWDNMPARGNGVTKAGLVKTVYERVSLAQGSGSIW